MVKSKLSFQTPNYYDLKTLCYAHGWLVLAPFEWNDDRRTICFAINMGNDSFDVSAVQKGE